MYHFLYVYILPLFLLLFLSVCVYFGYRFGKYQLRHHRKSSLNVVVVAEGSIFGILGLLVAFTFSGAYDRFEHRKQHLLEEANAFERAYEYIDLVDAKYQPALRKNMREYIELELSILHDIPYIEKENEDIEKAYLIQQKIWAIVIQATDNNKDVNIVQIVVPAMANMFEVAHQGFNITKIHPPGIIFFLLIGLAALGAFLIGYNSAENHQSPHAPMHSICYVLITAFLIYVIINLEFPRIGFVKLTTFDDVIVEVRSKMRDK